MLKLKLRNLEKNVFNKFFKFLIEFFKKEFIMEFRKSLLSLLSLLVLLVLSALSVLLLLLFYK